MNKGKHSMMEMYFHFRTDEVILFEKWVPQNVPIYVLSCITVFAMAFAFEILRSYRMLLIKKELSLRKCCRADVFNSSYGVSQLPNDEPPECDCNIVDNSINRNGMHQYSTFPFNVMVISSKYHYIQTFLYFLQMFWAYSLMLICMTYNVPLFLSLILGHSIAYIILSPFLNMEMEEKVGDCCS